MKKTLMNWVLLQSVFMKQYKCILNTPSVTVADRLNRTENHHIFYGHPAISIQKVVHPHAETAPPVARSLVRTSAPGWLCLCSVHLRTVVSLRVVRILMIMVEIRSRCPASD